MRYLLVPLLLAFLALSRAASAETITWFSSGVVFSVSPFADNFVGPGLVPGTPWSLTVSFDPFAAPTMTTFPGCNWYALSGTTLSLGPYSYTNTGHAVTNSALPEIGCIGALPEGNSGLIQFWYGTAGWQSDDPDAWDLNRWGGITYAGYYDLFATDGTLPLVPTFDPIQGRYGGFEIENNQFLGTLLYGGTARFQLLESQPTPVPEPATMMLFGAGLAASLAARRRRRV